ncbi:hypothetical protein AVEN_152502-1 [Araneus ventricosus]|uniref:C2H2-type domain-containing protein n=1 Tax=Araneus ventricosus TaxID=182803 RepID=A0A4Y2RL76_ARAVE|nr:hypothetical protein AVEN_152502-1 [Araneus ventricosus]
MPKRVYLKGDLDKHYRTQLGEKPLCVIYVKKTVCSEILSRQTYWTHTAEKPFVCDICQKGFYSRTHIDYHHQVQQVRSPLCEICKKKDLPQKGDLTALQNDTGEILCEVCQKGFQAHL